MSEKAAGGGCSISCSCLAILCLIVGGIVFSQRPNHVWTQLDDIYFEELPCVVTDFRSIASGKYLHKISFIENNASSCAVSAKGLGDNVYPDFSGTCYKNYALTGCDYDSLLTLDLLKVDYIKDSDFLSSISSNSKKYHDMNIAGLTLMIFGAIVCGLTLILVFILFCILMVCH